MKKRTAVLIFRREASEEIRRKRFWDRTPVINYLYKRTQRIARATGFEVIDHVDHGAPSPDQIQERLASTIKQAFEAGVSRLLVIGTDCPTLSTEDLLQAAQSLRQHHSVLGPDQRGGAYLMGFTKKSFQAHQFAQLPWGSSSFASQFLQRFPETACQSILFDLNTPTELSRLVKSEPRKHLLRPLIGLIAPLWKHPFSIAGSLEEALFFHKPLRAPPTK